MASAIGSAGTQSNHLLSTTDLPSDVYAKVAQWCTVSDLCNAACVSKAWSINVQAAWHSVAVRRWPHGSQPPQCAHAGADSAAAWHAHACRRAETDAAVLRCLRAMGDPSRTEGSLRELLALGSDTTDALLRAATWSDPRLVGLRYWARAALALAAAERALPRMRELMGKVVGEPEDMFEAALLVVSATWGGGWVG